MPLTKTDKLAIYRRNLARYEADGDDAKAEVERRLIKRIEGE